MVSIILPTYNEREQLPDTVQHLFEVLKSRRLQAEVIIVDDNSPDGTGEEAYYLKRYFPHLITLHREHRAGKTAALIDGIRLSRGQILGTAPIGMDLGLLPELIIPLISGNIDLTTARYLSSHPGGGSLRVRLQQLGERIKYPDLKPLALGFPLPQMYCFRRQVLPELQNLNAAAPNLLAELLRKGHVRRVQSFPD